MRIVNLTGQKSVGRPFADLVACNERKNNGKEGEEGKGDELEDISFHSEKDTEGRGKMEDGRWKMEDGRWKMEDGKRGGLGHRPKKHKTPAAR